MAIADDFTIDYVNQRIYYATPGSGDVYTSRELYTHIMNTFDELAQMDDTVPMSAQTPTEFTLINGWFMDERSFQFLKGGAIKTIGHDEVIRILTLASGGYVSAIAGDIGKTVTGGTTGDTGELLAYDNTLRKWWVRMDDSGDLFDDNDEAITIVVGGTGAGSMSAISVTGENLWANIYTLGTIEEDLTESEEQQIYIVQASARIFSGTEWWPEGGGSAITRHIDVLVKVLEADVPIGSGQISVFLRHYPSTPTALNPADLYDHFEIDLTNGGRNAVPLATANDLNNATATATVSGYSDITIAWVNGTVTHGGVTSGPFQEMETVTWAGGQGICLRDSSGTMTIGNVQTDNGPQNLEVITGSTSNATTTASANMTIARTMSQHFEQGSDYNYSVVIDLATHTLAEFYEYIKYVMRAGSTFSTYGTKTASATLSINRLQGQMYTTAYINSDTPANTYSPVKASPLGTFAGGTFFGARGIWIQDMDSGDIQSYVLTDSDGTNRNPPTFASITIDNLLSGDKVSVFKSTGNGSTTIDKAMYTAAAGNNSGNTTWVASTSITADTPSSGVIRLIDSSDTTNSREVRHTYTSWAGSTFSGLSPALSMSYTATDDKAYVPYIDKQTSSTSETVSVIFDTTKYLLIRVRRYTATAILPFETTGTFSSAGYSTSAIRTTDSIVQ